MTRIPFRLVAAVPTVFALAAALAVFPGGHARADSLTGQLEKVENGGSRVTIGGICDQGRDKLRPGMTCAAEVVDRAGTPEARRLSCK